MMPIRIPTLHRGLIDPQTRCCIQESTGRVMAGGGKYFRNRARLDDTPRLHDRYPSGDRAHQGARIQRRQWVLEYHLDAAAHRA